MSKSKAIIFGFVVGFVLTIPYLYFLSEGNDYIILTALTGVGVVIGYKDFVKKIDDSDLWYILGTTFGTLLISLLLGNAYILSKNFGMDYFEALKGILEVFFNNPIDFISDILDMILISLLGAFIAFKNVEKITFKIFNK